MCGIPLIAVVAGLFFSPANASTLFVIDQPGCQAAAHFMDDVGADYPTQGIPLKRIKWGQGWPEGIKTPAPVLLTPTFILIENGEEVGRIIGYSSKRGFWHNLEEVIRRR